MRKRRLAILGRVLREEGRHSEGAKERSCEGRRKAKGNRIVFGPAEYRTTHSRKHKKPTKQIDYELT